MEKEHIFSCYHCGDSCQSPILKGELVFCCEGCKSVYEILQDNDLCSYYDIENTPGIKLKSPAIKSQFAYLSNPEISGSLLQFTDGKISKVTLSLPQIHCSSCIWLLENLHKLEKGVIESKVNFLNKQVFITFDSAETDLKLIVELLANIGYAPDISLENSKQAKKGKTSQKLFIQMGVAGFCFGNIMLLSFPEYLTGTGFLEEGFKRFFGYLNFALVLPVFFYSASDYFKSAWTGVKHKHVNIDVPIVIGIVTLFIRSSFEIFTQNGTGYMDSLAGLVFFLLIGKWYQAKTYEALSFERDYQSYFPIAVTKLINKKEVHIPVKDIKKGDRILIHNEELIPVDSMIMSGSGLIDYSFVTGESEPVYKASGEQLYAGGKQKAGVLELEVLNEISQSYLTQLWNQEAFSKQEVNHVGNVINSISKYFTIIILSISLITLIYWLVVDPSVALNAFTSVLIIACPCALALSMPFALGNSLRILGRNGLFAKNAETIENLAKTNAIIFDKTGTITENSEAEIAFVGPNLSVRELAAIKALVKNSSHPLSRLLFKSLMKHEDLEVSSFQEITGQGISGEVKGLKFKIGSDQFVDASSAKPDSISTKVYVQIDGENKGYFEIKNKYRKGLKDLIGSLKRQFQIHILSGDNDSEKTTLTPIFGQSEMRFRQSPQDKLDYVKNLIENDRKVLMLGDGLNDAGALKQSHVGIAISDDVHTFSPACDAILDSSKFQKLNAFLAFSSDSMKVISWSFVISFVYNIIGISIAAKGLLTPLVAAILMPLSSVTVVAFVTLATSLYARKRGL